MKRLSLILLSLIAITVCNSQVTNKIQADSVRIYQTGSPGTSELILENATRSLQYGFLQNRYNGRTRFAYVLDSVWLSGGNLIIRRGPGNISIPILTPADTLDLANRITNIFRRNDSVFYCTFSACTFAYKDSTGGGGTVSSGSANRLAYYSGSGTTVDPLHSITPNRALISDGSGLPDYAATTATEINYVSGVTSPIQTQLNAKLSHSDTAAMLAGYPRRNELKDTAAAIRGDMGTGGGDLQVTTDLGNLTDNPIKIKTKDSVGTKFSYDWTTGTFSGWSASLSTTTATASAGKVKFSGGTLSLGNTISQAFYFGAQNWTLTRTVAIREKSNTSQGFGIRMIGTVGSAPDAFFHILLADTSGYIAHTVGAGLPNYSTSPNTRASHVFKWADDDSIDITVQRRGWTITCTVINRANGSKMSLTIRNHTLTVSRLSYYFYGGEWDFVGTELLTTDEVYRPKIVFLGDSHTRCVTCENENTSYPVQVMSGKAGGFAIMAAPFETAADGLLRAQGDLLEVSPEIATWAYGTNDGTTQANIDSLCARTRRFVILCQSASPAIEPVLISVLPGASATVIVKNDSLRAIATFFGIKFADAYAVTVAASGNTIHATFNADNVHLNQKGVNAEAQPVYEKVKHVLTATAPLRASPLPIISSPRYLMVTDDDNNVSLTRADSSNTYIKNNLYTAGVVNGQVADIHIDGTGNIGGRFQANGNGTDANPNLLVDLGTVTVPNFSASSGHFTVAGGQTAINSNWLQFPNGTAFIRTTGNGSMKIKTGISGAGSGTLGVCLSTEGSLPSVNFKPVVVQVADSNKAVFDRWGGLVLNWNGESTTKFQVKGDNDTAALYVNATSDNTGLGTISPEEKLHVVGKVKITDVPAGAVSSIDSLVVMEDGRIKVLVNYLGDGETSPTLTGVANVASSTTGTLYYDKQNDKVHCRIVFQVTPTAGATTTQIGIQLPIASNLANSYELSGYGTVVGSTFGFCYVIGDVTNDRAQLEFISTNTSSHQVTIQFDYKIIP